MHHVNIVASFFNVYHTNTSTEQITIHLLTSLYRISYPCPIPQVKGLPDTVIHVEMRKISRTASAAFVTSIRVTKKENSVDHKQPINKVTQSSKAPTTTVNRKSISVKPVNVR